MNRRNFLALSAGLPFINRFPVNSAEQNLAIPIIDTHIHLFDTNRPQGVPWPDRNDKLLYKPTLPEDYRKIAVQHGITGAVVVEASPWLEDNQWVLDTAAKDRIIVGVIGNIQPGLPEFGQQLARFQKNPLFRGIRYGNLWGNDLAGRIKNPGFISDLKSLAQSGLVLDTANPNPALLSAIVKLTDFVPDLKVIIDHLPQMSIPENQPVRKVYEADLLELGQKPQVYVKISEVLRRVNGRIPTALDFYRPRLDELYGIFGEDRLLYGSDWPNSNQWLPFEAGLNLVREYFMEKDRAVAEKYFWKNAVTAYNWQKRDPAQPN